MGALILVFIFAGEYINNRFMAVTLSPYRLGKARDLYNIFNFISSLSWQFLVSNIITIFALRLGASSTYIGILNAVLYFSYFFLPLGRLLTNRFSMVAIYSTAWIARSLGMIPVLFAPLFFMQGQRETALLLTLLGISLFHVCRGIGLIGNNPILSFLATGPDRGGYLTQVQIVSSAVSMFGGFAIALLLGGDPPLFLYAIIMGVGIGLGVFSGIIMYKIPGPEREEGDKNKKLSELVRDTMAQPSLRLFIYILLLVALVSGVSRTFIVVYSRGVFNQSDGMVALYAVFGGLGNLMVGLVIKFLVDKIGAKPIFSLCVVLGLVSMVPVIFFPDSLNDNFTTVTLYLTFLFFLVNFGWLGAEGVMQTYFMGLIPLNQMMDMGILYFFGFGIAGAAGTILGGMLLDLLAAVFGSQVLSFRVLFTILVVTTVGVLFLMRKLVPLGALPFKGALEVMFSYRDLKAITLLDKLDKNIDSGQEEALLEALRDAPSRLAVKGLLTRAKSPRLAVRMESIRVIDALQSLPEDAEKALMDDILHNPYTTAYISARTLGNHGVFKATPLLQELVMSDDYMLAGEAMIALAKLGDNAYRPQIEGILRETKNPRLKIMGVEAFGIYGSPDSLPILLDILKEVDPPPYLRDEVILAMANILDIQTKFYPLLVRFLADESLAQTLALDEVESAYENFVSVHGRKWKKKNPSLAVLGQQAKAFHPAVSDYFKHSKGRGLSLWIMTLPEGMVDTTVQTILSEAVLDEELTGHRRLMLLIVHWCAHQLRHWTKEEQ